MDSTKGFVRALRSTELVAREGLETELRGVLVGDDEVLVGRRGDGRVVAFGTACPHEMTDLEQATFVDGNVRCPRHNYLYDPITGQNVVPTRFTGPDRLWKLHPGYLPSRAVEEHDGWVWVSSDPNPAPPGWDPALEAPPEGEVAPSAEEAEAIARQTVEVPTKHLRVRLGAVFELRLPMTSPAHTWKVDVPGGLLALLSQQFDPVAARQRVRIAARSLGQGTLRCSYARPWDHEPEEVRTYLVDVVRP